MFKFRLLKVTSWPLCAQATSLSATQKPCKSKRGGRVNPTQLATVVEELSAVRGFGGQGVSFHFSRGAHTCSSVLQTPAEPASPWEHFLNECAKTDLAHCFLNAIKFQTGIFSETMSPQHLGNAGVSSIKSKGWFKYALTFQKWFGIDAAVWDLTLMIRWIPLASLNRVSSTHPPLLSGQMWTSSPTQGQRT